MDKLEIPPPPGALKRKRTMSLSWAILAIVVAFAVGVGIGVVGSPDDDEFDAGIAAPTASPVAQASPETPTVTETPSVTESPSPSPTAAAKLEGKWQLTACDLQLFTQGSNTSTLVGAVEVENTGNVPAEITVGLRWDALPGPLFDGGTKTVTLEAGRTRELRFIEKIDGNDVDRVQSSPGYESANDNRFCKVKARITNA